MTIERIRCLQRVRVQDTENEDYLRGMLDHMSGKRDFLPTGRYMVTGPRGIECENRRVYTVRPNGTLVLEYPDKTPKDSIVLDGSIGKPKTLFLSGTDSSGSVVVFEVLRFTPGVSPEKKRWFRGLKLGS